MKSILISIQPKWCELIDELIKKVEVRKTRPRCGMPFKCYIYCTKDEPLYHSGKKFWCKNAGEFGNGKVIGEFVCDRIDEIYQCNSGWVSENACISKGEFFDYLGIPRETHMGYDKKAYAWHISDLVIYDKPKELRDFYLAAYRQGNRVRPPKPLTRAPQSWCYVEEVAS